MAVTEEIYQEAKHLAASISEVCHDHPDCDQCRVTPWFLLVLLKHLCEHRAGGCPHTTKQECNDEGEAYAKT